MLYEELHRNYGSHVSQRLRRELTTAEFSHIDLDHLTVWLEQRAEAAHKKYRGLLNNPLASPESARAGEACKRWREAEDLAYLVAVTQDTDIRARAV